MDNKSETNIYLVLALIYILFETVGTEPIIHDFCEDIIMPINGNFRPLQNLICGNNAKLLVNM